jgi:hypothetical protein
MRFQAGEKPPFPMIFGTLFERSLDPDKQAQIGAH